MNEWMNECFYYRVIKNWLKASIILHTRQLNAERCGFSEGWSPVGIVWWVGEDLWWELGKFVCCFIISLFVNIIIIIIIIIIFNPRKNEGKKKIRNLLLLFFIITDYY